VWRAQRLSAEVLHVCVGKVPSSRSNNCSCCQNIPPGTCYVYDLAADTWRRGPTAPATPLTFGPSYWTPDGVITLGQSDGGRDPALAHTGGWLLRPAGTRLAGVEPGVSRRENSSNPLTGGRRQRHKALPLKPSRHRSAAWPRLRVADTGQF